MTFRPFTPDDLGLIAELHRDPEVGRYMGGVWPDAEIKAALDRFVAEQAERGHSKWAVFTRQGRFAAITNYRDPGFAQLAGAPSRGALVADFLRGSADAEAYAHGVAARAAAYNGFNLLVRDDAGLFYLSNRTEGVRRLAPGVYGLSNALLDTPWPKVIRAKKAMANALAAADGDAFDAPLWEVLADRVIAADDSLPDTGVGSERERLLSPPFIRTDVYGTRASSVLTIGRDGEVRFVERSVAPGQDGWTESRHAFRIRAPAAV
jgi:uncharacterized protein with NRDE domain